MKRLLLVGMVLLGSCFPVRSQTSQSPPPLPPPKDPGQLSNQRVFLESNGLDASPEPKSAPNVKRERVDQLNTVWFTAPGQSLQLNLFSDAQYTAVVDRAEMIDNVSVFYCHIQDYEQRPVILSYQPGIPDRFRRK